MNTLLDPVALTSRLVRYNSITGPQAENACGRDLGQWLTDAGFRVEYHEYGPGRPNLLARLGRSDLGPPLGFSGHLDVVPLGDQEWSVNPFGGDIVHGRVYGRGSTDMKGGIAAFVSAVAGLRRELESTAGVLLVITAAEETACQGALHLAKLGVLGNVSGLVLAEPTNNRPVIAHKGVLWVRAETEGVAAHGSTPQLGVNAIHKIADAVQALRALKLPDDLDPLMGCATLNIGKIGGGANINSVPDRAFVEVDIRTLPTMRHADIRDALEAALTATGARIDTLADLSGIWTDPRGPFVRDIFEIVKSETGATPAIEAAPYITDASALTPAFGGVPTVIWGPGDPALAHCCDEYIEVSRIEQATRFYDALLRRLVIK
ncbi:M20 family metallopeptidase [Hyphomicrobium sp.]|uniref:M20 family metallopeptidase n=1 Tax=Hyphomicrobium sp. TaxID=82 RepID=UPI001D81B9A8|nr:M20 family metallopeptidase [Hyphomicrobium sp.]MBY0558782.1 M20 family metallopeptidase [Hyphomicrobium sp.]